MTYEVQTRTLCTGWVNCWTDDEQPVTYANFEDALDAIQKYVMDCTEAVAAGDMQEAPELSDFRVAEVASC